MNFTRDVQSIINQSAIADQNAISIGFIVDQFKNISDPGLTLDAQVHIAK